MLASNNGYLLVWNFRIPKNKGDYREMGYPHDSKAPGSTRYSSGNHWLTHGIFDETICKESGQQKAVMTSGSPSLRFIGTTPKWRRELLFIMGTSAAAYARLGIPSSANHHLGFFGLWWFRNGSSWDIKGTSLGVCWDIKHTWKYIQWDIRWFKITQIVVSSLTKPTVWFGVDPSDPMDPYGFWGVLAFGGELVELVVVFCSQPWNPICFIPNHVGKHQGPKGCARKFSPQRGQRGIKVFTHSPHLQLMSSYNIWHWSIGSEWRTDPWLQHSQLTWSKVIMFINL